MNHIHYIEKFLPPKSLRHVIQTPPELITGKIKLLFRRLFHPINLIRGRLCFRQDTILIYQYTIDFKAALYRLHGTDMQIQPVSIRKLHQPAITVFHIRTEIYAIFRILHKQPFPESVNPLPVLTKGFSLVYNIYHIVILKNILGNVRVNAGSFQIRRPDTRILFCSFYNQIKHFFF